MNLKFFKYLFFSPVDFFILFISIVNFKITKKTYSLGHKSMIRLFCLTGGWSNDLISFFTVKKKLINKVYNPEIIKIVDNLKENGYFLINNFISEKTSQEIEDYVINQDLIINSNDERSSKIYNKKFNPSNPEGVVYLLPDNKLIENSLINQIIKSDLLRDVASKYFEAEAILDHAQISIVTDYKKIADKNSAQYYHFDLDKPKWLKFFIYLNNVNLDRGPHSFIPKTHKNSGIHVNIRSQGYSRIEDSEIRKYYTEEIIFAHNKGTCIIEDTRGLHKGYNCKKGYRCLINIQYSNSFFGFKNAIL